MTNTQTLIDVNKQMEEMRNLQPVSGLQSQIVTILTRNFSHGSSQNHLQDSNPSRSVTPIASPSPSKPPDPPDRNKSDPISPIKAAPEKTQASSLSNLTPKIKKGKLAIPLKYSCEEIYERMDNGLCIFCEEQDIPGHQLKHKGFQIFFKEGDDDLVSDAKEVEELAVEEISDECMDKSIETVSLALDQEEKQAVDQEDDTVVEDSSSLPKEYMEDSLTLIKPSNDIELSFSQECSDPHIRFPSSLEMVMCNEGKISNCLSGAVRVWEPGGLSAKLVSESGVKDLKSINLIQDEEPSLEKESRPEQESYQVETFVYPLMQMVNSDPEEFKIFGRKMGNKTHEQKEVTKSTLSWNNRVWVPGGVLTELDKWKELEKRYEKGRMSLVQPRSSMDWQGIKSKELELSVACSKQSKQQVSQLFEAFLYHQKNPELVIPQDFNMYSSCDEFNWSIKSGCKYKKQVLLPLKNPNRMWERGGLIATCSLVIVTPPSDFNVDDMVAQEVRRSYILIVYEVTETFEKLRKSWQFKFKSTSDKTPSQVSKKLKVHDTSDVCESRTFTICNYGNGKNRFEMELQELFNEVKATFGIEKERDAMALLSSNYAYMEEEPGSGLEENKRRLTMHRKSWHFKFRTGSGNGKLMGYMSSFVEESSGVFASEAHQYVQELCPLANYCLGIRLISEFLLPHFYHVDERQPIEWEEFCKLMVEVHVDAHRQTFSKDISHYLRSQNEAVLKCHCLLEMSFVEFVEGKTYIKELLVVVLRHLTLADVQLHLKQKWRSKPLQSNLGLETDMGNVVIMTLLIMRNELEGTKLCFWSSNEQRTGYTAENKRLMDTEDGINKAIAICEANHFQEIGYGKIGHKLLLPSETFSKEYKEDSWLFVQTVLTDLRTSGFGRETWTVKKSHEWLNELTTAVDAVQRVYGAVPKPASAFEFIHVQPRIVHFPYPPNDVVKAHGMIPVKKMFTCHYKGFSIALVQWKEHLPPKQATWEVFSELHQGVFKFSSLRTRMFSTGEYCYRKYNPVYYTSIVLSWFSYLSIGLVGLMFENTLCKARVAI